jgi:hypothetical protein
MEGTTSMTSLSYSCDPLAWKLAEALLEDFRPFLSQSFYDAVSPSIGECNILALRKIDVGDFNSLSAIELKARRQLLDLFKKYSFEHDVFTDDEVLEQSKKKFLDNQDRINAHVVVEDNVLKNILFTARGFVDRILGDFDKFEVMKRATFGKKSSVGIPKRKACEAQRYEGPITGSCDQIEWFERLYSLWNKPAYLYAKLRAENREVPLYSQIDALEAILVNKTWKSKRMIMPNTTIGTLYSGGLGKVIEDALRAYGYDIKTLQDTHGELARFGSITGSLVTADQSLASDNITSWLIDRICPREWASALNFGRIRKINFYGQVVETNTFSTMGIGFTFPLQTLVFLCLLLAIREQCDLDETHVVSVFGDDMIYDVKMHDLVVDTFTKLGLVINVDKTFSEGWFRESCGRDFYRGVDVRPWHLSESMGSDVPIRRFEAYLYKAINGLRRRWTDLEVPCTLAVLLTQLVELREGKPPLMVPSDYPDTSGVKLHLNLWEEWELLRRPQRSVHGVYSFRYLAFEPDLRKEDRCEPYLWLSLRSSSEPDSLALLALSRIKGGNRAHGTILQESPPILLEKTEEDARSYRSKLTGKRHRQKSTFIPEQDKGRFRERPGVTGNWAPVR